jgi:hypothetical protein
MTGGRFASRYQRVIVCGHPRDRHRYVLRPLPLASAISTILVGSAPLVQAQTAQDSSTLEAVVVTAQKKTENLQDVPISISVFDSQKMEQPAIPPRRPPPWPTRRPDRRCAPRSIRI